MSNINTISIKHHLDLMRINHTQNIIIKIFSIKSILKIKIMFFFYDGDHLK